MERRGYTLIELLVVMTIMAVLLGLATINFNNWQNKNMVERHVKELYSDIQEARMNAAYTKMRQGVEFSAQQVTFKRFSSDYDMVGKVVSTKQVPMTLNRTNWSSPAANRIDFNTSGIMSDPVIKVICFSTTVDAAYDALIITPALTNMGKVTNRGAKCGQNNVTQK